MTRREVAAVEEYKDIIVVIESGTSKKGTWERKKDEWSERMSVKENVSMHGP